MEKFLKFLLALAMMLLPLMLKAQNCTEIYGQALEIRKTRTVEAQQKSDHAVRTGPRMLYRTVRH